MLNGIFWCFIYYVIGSDGNVCMSYLGIFVNIEFGCWNFFFFCKVGNMIFLSVKLVEEWDIGIFWYG